MEPTLQSLQKEIAHLRLTLDKSLKDTMASISTDAATSHTMTSVIMEIAVKLGCPRERLERCWKQRQDYFLQETLLDLEKLDKPLAAELDTRALDKGSAIDEFEPLFEP